MPPEYGWQASNCGDRTIQYNGVTVTAGEWPLPSPATWTDGYAYFSFTAGNMSGAEFSIY